MGFIPAFGDTLTNREEQVLLLLATCRPFEIALILGIHKGTMNKYTEGIYRKIGGQNRCEVVMKAISKGLYRRSPGACPLGGGEVGNAWQEGDSNPANYVAKG